MPFDALDLRPGRVVLIGAPPAAGKTTLTLQLVSAVLANHPDLAQRRGVGNVEMAPAALVEEVARPARRRPARRDPRSGHSPPTKRPRRVEAATVDHLPLLDRIAFLDAPYSLRHLAGAMVEFCARLAVVDYAQRFTTGEGDDRAKLDAADE